MNRLLRLFGTTIGRKLVVAVSGFLMIGFLIAHMFGNMVVFQGRDAMNSYAAWLQGHPLLWIGRLALLGVFCVHVYLALRLALANRAARPLSYEREQTVAASVASRRIALTGLLVLLFVLYHLLHFTFGQVQPEHASLIDGNDRHDVYAMMVYGFQSPWVAGSYVAAMLLLGMHLAHGASSLFQTLGFNHESYNALIRLLSFALVAAIVIGNCSIPILVLAGVISPTGGP